MGNVSDMLGTLKTNINRKDIENAQFRDLFTGYLVTAIYNGDDEVVFDSCDCEAACKLLDKLDWAYDVENGVPVLSFVFIDGSEPRKFTRKKIQSICEDGDFEDICLCASMQREWLKQTIVKEFDNITEQITSCWQDGSTEYELNEELPCVIQNAIVNELRDRSFNVTTENVTLLIKW